MVSHHYLSSTQLPNRFSFTSPTHFTPPRHRAPPLPPLTPLSSPVKQVPTPMKQRPGKRMAPEDERPIVPSDSLSKKRARTVEGVHEMDTDIVLLDQQTTAAAHEALVLEEDGLAIID